MSNNAHFFAVDPDALRSNWDPEDFFPPTPGLSWCGDTFETGWAFRSQLDEIVGPFLSTHLRAVIDGSVETVTDPAVALLRSNEIQCEITPFTPAEFSELRRGVRGSLESGAWDGHNDLEWRAFAADETAAPLYVLVEFV